MSDNLFHDHLDVCDRCRNQPFNLCEIGTRALHTHAQSHCPTGVGLVGNPMRSFEDAFSDVFGSSMR